MAGDRRELVAAITADPKGLDAGLANASRRGRRGAEKLGRDLSAGVKRGFGTITDLMGIGGVAGAIAATKRVKDFHTRLLRLRQSSRASAADMKRLNQMIGKVAMARGLERDDLLGGAETFVEKTGDLQGYVAQLDQLGKVGTGTGVALADLAAISAAANKSMGVAPGDTERMFDVLASQASQGTVELKNMASELPSLIALQRNFAKTGVDGIAEMGAMVQVAMDSFGSASEAATGYRRLLQAIIVKSKDLKKHRINVFDETGKMRSVEAIMTDLAKSKLASGGKNEAKLIKLLGSSEAFLAFKGIKEGLKKQADGQTKLGQLLDQKASAGFIDEAAKMWDESDAGKMARSLAKMDVTLDNVIGRHMGAIANAVERAADALDFIVANLKTLLPALLAGKGAGMLVDMAGGGGGGKGGKRGGMGGVWDKVQAASLSFGVGYMGGTALDEATGGALHRGVSTGVGSVIDVIDPGFKERWRDRVGVGSDRKAAEARDNMMRGKRVRTRVREDLLSQAFAATGTSADMFRPEDLQRIRGDLTDDLRGGGGLRTPTELVGAQQLPELIQELKRLREAINRQGPATVNVSTDETLVRRRGG
jgi:hypothetical protein